MDRRLFALLLAGALVLTAASLLVGFYIGRWHGNLASPTNASAPLAVEATDDSAKRLQLDALCAQSAAAFAPEHDFHEIFGSDQTEYEHAYNPRLAKCMILIMMGFRGTGVLEKFLYETTNGTMYARMRRQFVRTSETEGHQELQDCTIIRDGKTAETCTTEDDWNRFVNSMMNR